MKICFQKITETAQVPKRAHDTDAGLDLCADESLIIRPGETKLVSTGLKMEMDSSREKKFGALGTQKDIYAKATLEKDLTMVAFVCARSGMAVKGIEVLNSPGVIDYSYRGEIKVILHNSSRENYEVVKGNRIAQLVCMYVLLPEIFEVETLSETTRGEGGFGSSGV